MNGLMTLLTGVLALLTLCLLAFFVGKGSNMDSIASPGPVASVTRSQQAGPLPELSPELLKTGSDTCQEAGDVYEGKLDSELTGTAASVVSPEPEAAIPADAAIQNDLKLPEGLSLDFSGTGETCK